MQLISTKHHALIDYLIGVALICTPFVLYTWSNSMAMWVLIYAGFAIIFYGLVTRYEYSLLKVISIRFHHTLDMFVALLLITSPWIFDFYQEMCIPHIFYGALEMGLVIFSSPKRVHQIYTGYRPHRTYHKQ